jgi:pentatricopeptide repeat protein
LQWNKKLKTYVKDGQLEKALQLFQQIKREGMSLDKLSFIQVVNACAWLQALNDGKHVCPKQVPL